MSLLLARLRRADYIGQFPSPRAKRKSHGHGRCAAIDPVADIRAKGWAPEKDFLISNGHRHAGAHAKMFVVAGSKHG